MDEDGADGEAVVTVVVVHVGIARIEVEVPGISGIVRVERTRPVVADRPLIVQTRIVPVARGGQEHAVARQSPSVSMFVGSPQREAR